MLRNGGTGIINIDDEYGKNNSEKLLLRKVVSIQINMKII